MAEAELFAILTVILVLLGLVMPYTNAWANDSSNSVNQFEDLQEESLSYTDFVGSLLRAFFWYYGELGAIANMIKVIINIMWGYCLFRLLRGGG